jgi:multicomponent Na+:H+ antiporter subunit E
MAFQILTNLLMAVVWAALQNSYTPVDFFMGYLIGLIILFTLRRFLYFDFYFRRVWAAIKLAAIFSWELIVANIDIAKMVLHPKMEMKPGIVKVPTTLKTEGELTLLAMIISLTPGTLIMDFSPDNRFFYIHSVHMEDKEDVIAKIRDVFEKAIMEVTE